MCVVFRQCRVNSVSVTCSQMTVEDSVCRASAPQLLRDNWAHFLSIQYPHVKYLKVQGRSQQGACTHINDTRPRIQTRCDTVGTHSQHTLIPSALFATGFLLMAQLFINLNIRGFSLHIYFSLLRCHREGSRQPACCARLFDVPIICPNVDWSVYQFIQLMMVDSSQHHRRHTVMTCWCTYWSRCLPLKGLQQTFNFLIFNSLFGQHITIMLAREYQTWILIQSCL